MTVRPPEGSEEPEAVDPVMLAVLSNRGRTATVLSPEEERLLDDWLAGRLSPEAGERAAALVSRNSLAAERVLEAALRRVDRARANVQNAEARAAAGLASTNDATRAALEVATAQREVATAEGRVGTAYLNLGFLMNRKLAAPATGAPS